MTLSSEDIGHCFSLPSDGLGKRLSNLSSWAVFDDAVVMRELLGPYQSAETRSNWQFT